MESHTDILSLIQHNMFNLFTGFSMTGFSMGLGLAYAMDQGRLDHVFLSIVCPGLYLGIVASDVLRSFKGSR